jgi:hypothetical protein
MCPIAVLARLNLSTISLTGIFLKALACWKLWCDGYFSRVGMLRITTRSLFPGVGMLEATANLSDSIVDHPIIHHVVKQIIPWQNSNNSVSRTPMPSVLTIQAILARSFQRRERTPRQMSTWRAAGGAIISIRYRVHLTNGINWKERTGVIGLKQWKCWSWSVSHSVSSPANFECEAPVQIFCRDE